MDILMYLGIFIVSLVVLLKAADYFIESAEKIGLSFGISPFVIGITIVAFGTSLPELATSIASVLNGQSEIVIGNVVGSNVANIAMVIGLVTLAVKRIPLSYNLWHIDISFLLGSSFLLYFTLQDLHFSIMEAVVFLVFLGLFLLHSVIQTPEDETLISGLSDDAEKPAKATAKDYILLIVGGAFVAIGADYTIYGITKLSEILGIAPDVIAQSAVALGTSLPEVIVSIKSARKGSIEIAVGNVMGSNVFNILLVMSIPRFFGDLVIPAEMISFSIPFMLVLTLMFAVMTNNKKVTNFEGGILLIFYIYYMLNLFA